MTMIIAAPVITPAVRDSPFGDRLAVVAGPAVRLLDP
jgi:hypothetical protein